MEKSFERQANESAADWAARLQAIEDSTLSPPTAESKRFWLDVAQEAVAGEPQPPTREEIALAAYFLWQREGYQHGRDEEYWCRAAEQLRRDRGFVDGDRDTLPG